MGLDAQAQQASSTCHAADTSTKLATPFPLNSCRPCTLSLSLYMHGAQTSSKPLSTLFFSLQVGSSANLGTSSSMMGNVVAYTQIGMSESAVASGSIIALGVAVNLVSNVIKTVGCYKLSLLVTSRPHAAAHPAPHCTLLVL